ncbi:MAG: cardiolipin synthase [Clostridia bacterium]|nr:cardiolipin synthase [Clostridia bacterium]
MGSRRQHKRVAKMQSRLIIAAIFVLLQLAVFTAVAYFFAARKFWVYTLLEAISIIIVIYILANKGNPSYKLTWIIYILIFPIVGGLAYLVWGGGRVFPYIKRRMITYSRGSRKYLKQDRNVKNRLVYDDLIHARQATFLTATSGFPVYDGTKTDYLSPGERAFPVILEDLKKAEKYIFIEFFIIADGSMWEEIFAILKEKVAKGVEVRVIFDDFGSITKQYRHFKRRLEEAGILVQVFNRIHASLDIFQNNRNHRKIIVVDGKVAFTGGMNISDEYINRVERFGYWMDCALRLEGKAVASFVVMFLSMWGFCTGRPQRFNRYITDYSLKANGFVQPYCDGPINNQNPGEGIYMQLLNTAQKYVYIATPYLIVDNTMTKELTLAASSGIDVRILVPKIPDKTYVHPVTQYSYDELLAAGVRIFEYSPGFIHSKFFVSDDSVATVGTVNMDYRSFFFHFECGAWLCRTDSVKEIKKHFLQMQKQSEEIILEKWRKRPLKLRFKQAILNLFAPFM